MKELKLSLAGLLTAITLAATLSAQTNTFPASGNVGIGTTTPATKLNLQDANTELSMGLNGDPTTYNRFGFNSSYYGYWTQNAYWTGVQWNYVNPAGYNGAAVKLQEYSGSFQIDTALPGGANPVPWNTRFYVANSGNVGIGTASPTARLQVNTSVLTKAVFGRDDGAAAENSLVRINTAGASNFSALGFDAAANPASGAAIWIQTNGNGLYMSGGGATYTSLASTAPHMAISPAGNVGIGTVNPTGKLTVHGAGGSAASDGVEWYSGGNATGYFGWVGRIYGGTPTGGWATAPFVFSVPDGSGGEIKTMTLINGNVGIGTTNPSHKLAVNGTIRAKEVIVDTGWSDYVFDQDYRLAPLSEVEQHIRAEKHLPGIPSAAEVAEHGVSMGDMQSKLLAKVEELTLHLIAQEKEIAALRCEVADLKTANH